MRPELRNMVLDFERAMYLLRAVRYYADAEAECSNIMATLLITDLIKLSSDIVYAEVDSYTTPSGG